MKRRAASHCYDRGLDDICAASNGATVQQRITTSTTGALATLAAYIFVFVVDGKRRTVIALDLF